MAGQHFTDSYRKAFALFLAHTDEKEALLGHLTRSFGYRKTSSILDIGAGGGELAIPLSRAVARYVAIEQREDYCGVLRKAHVEVVKGVFPPLPIPGDFDLVLASHVLPHTMELCEPFVSAAWALVAPGGRLTVITYSDMRSAGKENAWRNLLEACNLSTDHHGPRQAAILMEMLPQYAKGCRPASILMETRVKTRTLAEMVEALAFVYSDGDAERFEQFVANREVAPFLEECYLSYAGSRISKSNGYDFPFEHLIIDLNKAE